MTLLAPSASSPLLDERDYGEVFTRRWVVEMILDLCGYTADRDLAELRAVEPACGSGAFIVPMVERLIESARSHGHDLATAQGALRATDLLPQNVATSRSAAADALLAANVASRTSNALVRKWIRQGDFLLDPAPWGSADVVVGNPPYIRLEAVSREVSDAYRRACPTMGGRSDVYVGFYEHGLQALKPGGVLGFICADRWMRNAYGARLRGLIAREWSVEALVSMIGVDAFEDEVDAYPAVTVLRRAPQMAGTLVVNAAATFGERDARRVSRAARAGGDVVDGAHFQAARLPEWPSGQSAWPHGTPEQLAAIVDLESRLPSLEDRATGTRVGIGVATGADRVFIVSDPTVAEPERLLRLAMAGDTASGSLAWSGHHLVNPWDEEGLVDLRRWPRMESYLAAHKPLLSRRHTAKRGAWHRTIDRVIEGLADQEKLYLPDFKDATFPVLDRGETYPHHNLYWITSDGWDLEVLGGILLSDVANLFTSAYSVRMRGGYLRFQAQYLRRIRVPALDRVDAVASERLREAFRARDRRAATDAVLPLYGLDEVPA